MTKMEQDAPKRHSSRRETRVWHAPDRMVGARGGYDRNRDLPRLVPMWPSEMAAADATLVGHLKLIGRIAKALRIERQCGLAGHWTYDAGRHRNLVAAITAEREQCRIRWGVRPQASLRTVPPDKVRPVIRASKSGKKQAPPPEDVQA